jgi:hypothetical protein
MIVAQLNLTNGTWNLTKNIDGREVDLCIGFTDGTERVVFDGLRFGFIFNEQTMIYPPDGTVYEATDQEYISSDRVQVKPGTNADLHVWAENAGQHYETTTTVDIPLPPQPYPSWTLDDDANWQPPVAYPDDGEPYTWDEDEQTWQPVETADE